MAIEVPADLAATVYADADAADGVAELRVGGAAWLALTSDQKDQALATATRDIDTVDFIGDRSDDDQLLEWPRTGTDYSDDAWPQRLIDATIELAFSYVPLFAAGATGDAMSADPSNGNIKREKVGTIETEYFAATSAAANALERFPAVVQRLLGPLVSVVEENAWGSAAVVRGS